VCWAIEVGRAMATTIIGEIPEFGGGDGPFETLRMGTESSTLRALVLLARPDSGLPAITEEALAGERDFVRRNIPLDKVLRGIRFGHAGMARAFLDGCEARVEARRLPTEMQAVSDELFAIVDAFADAMVSTYLVERDQWITSAAAARAETVQAVLSGEPLDQRAAARALDYPFDRCHLGLSLWTETSTGGDVSALQRAAVELLQRRGATATLVVPVGSTQLWAWGAVPDRPAALVAPDGPVRVAAGLPAAGLTGFRSTHRQALDAERVGKLGGRRVVDYADIAAVALLSADLPAAAELVRRELGALAARTDQAETLRRTLLHYLDAERSLVAVAGELHVARGTVAYRVKRAEELLGRDVGERRFELHAALLLAGTLGDAVLAPEN
jgi:hypothetical protein